MGDKSSINYIVAHEKIRNLVFEDWKKINFLISQGPELIKQYFCKLWNEARQELEYEDDIDIIDIDKQIKPDDFDISYSNLDNGMRAFNFIMPRPLTNIGQVSCLSLVITRKIPRLFTLEVSDSKKEYNSYSIGEWLIDFKKNDYIHRSYENMDEPIIGEFLGKINKIVN